MISFTSHMPLLRIGSVDIAHYEAGWLEEVLRRAATEAGHEQWWPARDVARGVIQFLRDRFQQKVITLQDLFGKIQATLQGIGFADIAERVQPEAPPVVVSLSDLAAEAGGGFELLFFRALGERVREMRELGVSRLHCTGTREAVLHFTGSTVWNADCADFEAEVVDFLREAAARANSAAPFTLLLT